MKGIVLYCSLTGNTEKIAKRIARDFQCDILKIEPDIVYGGYLSAVVRVFTDKMAGDLPGSVTDTPDLSGYDTVFVGFPIWYGTVPEFAQEFLMRCDFNGKRLFPFATSSASDITKSVEKLAEICDGAEIMKPFTFSVMHRDNFSDWVLDVMEACEEEEPETNASEEKDSAENAAPVKEADDAEGAVPVRDAVHAENAGSADSANSADAADSADAAGSVGDAVSDGGAQGEDGQ